MKKIIAILFLLFLIPTAFGQIPKLNSYVTDKSGVLSQAAISSIENQLRHLEKETNGVQFVIFIENEYPRDYSFEEYTLKIAEDNGIGKGENDNGVLLYVAVKDRAYRWEIGYGAESTLNTPLLGRISREYLVPNFQANDYESGIVSSVDVVSRMLLNSNDPDIVALKQGAASSQKLSKLLSVFIFFMIISMIIISIVVQSKARNYYNKHGKWPDYYYTSAAAGMFAGGFGRGKGPGGFGGMGGFGGGGGGFGGGGFSGRF